MSATDAAIQKKPYGSGHLYDIMKIVKSFKESQLLIKWFSKAIKNKAKEQKGGFLSMLLEKMAATLLGSALTGQGVIRVCEGLIKAGQKNLMLPQPLTN